MINQCGTAGSSPYRLYIQIKIDDIFVIINCNNLANTLFMIIVLRALELLLAEWTREDFLVRQPGFFSENGRYSETKSQKTDPKVVN